MSNQCLIKCLILIFALSSENEDGRTSYEKCYMPTVEIKDCTVLIGYKNFFDIPIKNKEEAEEKK